MNIYRSKYTERAPAINPSNDDECRELGREHGVRAITMAPMRNVVLGSPPANREDASALNGTHLWIVTNSDVPMIQEYSQQVSSLESGCAKHTNLTGCGLAYCGGEVWFQSEATIYISGGSGRYGPREPVELDEICNAFGRLGYNVVSLGWDEEGNRPARYLRDER